MMQALLLPYLEGDNQYNFFNFSLQVNGQAVNATARVQMVSAYLCPSDPMTVRNLVASLVDATGTNYQPCLGSHSDYAGAFISCAANTMMARTQYHGAFYRNSAARMRDFTDGTTKTALMSEIMRGPNGPGSFLIVAAGSPDDLRVATNITGATWTGVDQFAPPITCENRAINAWAYRGLQYYRALLVASYYNHTMPPNARRRDCITSSLLQGHMAARSFHPGGVNVLLGDGSVQFASDSVSLEIWRGYGTVNNGETGVF